MTSPNRLVYVIDDDADMLKTLSESLRDSYDVKCFTSATQLLAELEKGVLPDLFITDIKMPEMDGLQLCKVVRANGIDRPVIIVTGYADKSHALKALELGVFALVEKPFSVRQLRSVVLRATGHSLLVELSKNAAAKYESILVTLKKAQEENKKNSGSSKTDELIASAASEVRELLERHGQFQDALAIIGPSESQS